MRGFTLIEVLVYIGLYTLLLGGACAALFAIQVSAERDDSRARLLTEGQALLITLERHTENGDDPGMFSVADGALVQARSSGPARLSSSNVSVSDLSLMSQEASGSDPEPIVVRFSLQETAYGAQGITHSFEASVYRNAP